MTSYKERWFADFERRISEHEFRGLGFNQAYERAARETLPRPIGRTPGLGPGNSGSKPEGGAK